MAATEKPRRLGRGLSSLLGEPVRINAERSPSATTLASSTEAAADPGENPQILPDRVVLPKDSAAGRLVQAPIDSIVPSRFQPRQTFDEAALASLASSIKASGVMQPIAVRPRGARENGGEGGYELIAGERRWRAARLAGLERIPAVVTTLDDQEAAEWALVENLQRSDLNPMERAWAFRGLSERFELSHAEIADRVGFDRSSVANFIRLTELEDEIRGHLAAGRLSAGHGKALLSAPSGPARAALADRAVRESWSVRKLEAAAGVAAAVSGKGRAKEGEPPAQESSRREAARRDLEKRLSEKLGARVKILTRGGTRGSVVIDFADLDHFEAILSHLGLSES